MFDIHDYYMGGTNNESIYYRIPMRYRNHPSVDIVMDGSVRIRYRGPRPTNAHHTLKKDATHFSIYSR